MKYVYQILLIGCLALLSGCLPEVTVQEDEIVKTQTGEVFSGEKQPALDEKEIRQPATTDEERQLLEDYDSSYSGRIETEVTLSTQPTLNPRQFAGNENEQERERCQNLIAAGDEPTGCDTDYVLKMQKTDGEGLPRELLYTAFSEIDRDPLEISIGCETENGRTAAPIRTLGEAGLESIVSAGDQALLLASIENKTKLFVRIEKNAYDIGGRGGTNCDIFFNGLTVLRK